MKLLLFILICYGTSNIMVFSSIFSKWRTFWLKVSPNFLGELFTCMICLPTWCGIILSLLIFSPTMTFLGVSSIFFSALLDGIIASGAVWLIHTIQESLEKNG
jgi:hypothetical protein